MTEEIKVFINLGGGAVIIPACRPEMEEGQLRADVDPLMKALGWEADANKLQSHAVILYSRKKPTQAL